MTQSVDIYEVFKNLKPLSTEQRNELFDNGLNVRCTKCNEWVSKRVFPSVLVDGLCPDCRREERNRKSF